MSGYEGWAFVEQMGFRQTVALVSEVEQYGTKMMRIEVPYFVDGKEEPAGFVTRFAGGPSIYQVSPLDVALALDKARRQSDPRPVNPAAYRLAHQAPSPAIIDADALRDEPELPIERPPDFPGQTPAPPNLEDEMPF